MKILKYEHFKQKLPFNGCAKLDAQLSRKHNSHDLNKNCFRPGHRSTLF